LPLGPKAINQFHLYARSATCQLASQIFKMSSSTNACRHVDSLRSVNFGVGFSELWAAMTEKDSGTLKPVFTTNTCRVAVSKLMGVPVRYQINLVGVDALGHGQPNFVGSLDSVAHGTAVGVGPIPLTMVAAFAGLSPTFTAANLAGVDRRLAIRAE
jgi:hypothetical protein